jgi:hypothetical protein
MNRFLEKEETLLTPNETSFRMEAKVYDAKYLDTKNFYDEYAVVFQPLDYYAFQNFHELVENAISQVELRKDRYSNKEAKKRLEDKRGMLYSSQLFPPKVNVEYKTYRELECLTATITGHLRDLPNGDVVINIDYIDFDDPLNGISPELQELFDDDEDDGW